MLKSEQTTSVLDHFSQSVDPAKKLQTFHPEKPLHP